MNAAAQCTYSENFLPKELGGRHRNVGVARGYHHIRTQTQNEN